MKTVKIIRSSQPEICLTIAKCDSFYSKLAGLMFRREIAPFFGLLFSDSRESRLNSAIHMFFMNFDIAVLWLNKDFVIIDKVLARRWHVYYAPHLPAQFTVELHPDRFEDFVIGDQLRVLN